MIDERLLDDYDAAKEVVLQLSLCPICGGSGELQHQTGLGHGRRGCTFCKRKWQLFWEDSDLFQLVKRFPSLAERPGAAEQALQTMREKGCLVVPSNDAHNLKMALVYFAEKSRQS